MDANREANEIGGRRRDAPLTISKRRELAADDLAMLLVEVQGMLKVCFVINS